MKELIHLCLDSSQVDDYQQRQIDLFVENNPDVSYSRVCKDSDPNLFNYYVQQYVFPEYPVFLGLVDGKLQDGHYGPGTEMVLSSLIN